ncbi:ABC transporter permease [Enterococcus cecorum]|uniref:ABC transporter permease n=1 Tax=Enterococcus cecorum TaxID=44008 RepID=UPI002ACA48CA|nr:ABC transporter permease [Enterococcus cecorum]MDZ5503072.1 ABC transporter permease [Enterococcus cecorum]MDZ5556965.1 ABC transporter permease [Enterococcus cecorum]MDZ5558926.1 ABC transporter permease [Enterococcus cecorum]MDZ5591981.1 ABC transporter permease [Enterococcus cecorum]MDZ5612833.1 ABC transporter permease [Enterococcus cecorum]
MHNKSERIQNIIVPIIAVILGFVLGGLIMLGFGFNPMEGYGQMFKTAFLNPLTGEVNSRNIGEIFVSAAPLIFTALGFSIANTAGFFNIGLSGQALCGWVTSIWIALSMPDAPRFVVLLVAIVAGVLSGAIAGAIPGFLRAFFGTSEVIVTIMMNYILLHIGNHIVNNVMSPKIIQSKGMTVAINKSASLQTPWLAALTNNSRLNLGIFFAIIALVVVWFVMKKTTLGYEIRAVGLNPYASEYAGMSSKRTIIVSMVISGALAGMGGVVLGLGTFENFTSQSSSLAIGFDGMAVSLLGNGSSLGIFAAALLFSVLQLGGQGMQVVGIPSELVNIDIAIIIFFVGISFVIRYILAKFTGKKAAIVKVEKDSKPNEESQEGGTI